MTPKEGMATGEGPHLVVMPEGTAAHAPEETYLTIARSLVLSFAEDTLGYKA